MRPLSCLIALAASLSACSEANTGAPSSYEAWAEKVATIPLAPSDTASSGTTSAPLLLAENPVQPSKNAPLRVELMSPHQLWDLRDGPLKIPDIEVAEGTTRPVLISAQAETSATPSPASQPVIVVPASPTTRSTAPSATQPSSSFRTVQLGAYSSEDSARTAWNRLATSDQAGDLRGLVPQFEPTEVSGRTLVRLRVSAPQDKVQNLCRTVASDDPWCVSSARSGTSSTMFH